MSDERCIHGWRWPEECCLACCVATIDDLRARLAEAERERDEAAAHRDWAMKKLRDMNHDRKRWSREFGLASAKSPRRPYGHLVTKNPRSVAEWLRYLLHKVRSQAGEIRRYGQVKAAMERMEHALPAAAHESTELPNSDSDITVPMAIADLQSPAAWIRRSEEERPDEAATAGGSKARKACPHCGTLVVIGGRKPNPDEKDYALTIKVTRLSDIEAAEAEARALREALSFLLSSFRLVLVGKPCRNADEAIAAAESALRGKGADHEREARESDIRAETWERAERESLDGGADFAENARHWRAEAARLRGKEADRA